MSRRSFRATKDQYDELPNDKEKLTQIMVAKNRHLRKMQKMLDDAENDAIESDMISDPEELQKMLRKLELKDKDLNKEVNLMPSKIGRCRANPRKEAARVQGRAAVLREDALRQEARNRGPVSQGHEYF